MVFCLPPNLALIVNQRRSSATGGLVSSSYRRRLSATTCTTAYTFRWFTCWFACKWGFGSRSHPCATRRRPLNSHRSNYWRRRFYTWAVAGNQLTIDNRWGIDLGRWRHPWSVSESSSCLDIDAALETDTMPTDPAPLPSPTKQVSYIHLSNTLKNLVM